MIISLTCCTWLNHATCLFCPFVWRDISGFNFDYVEVVFSFVYLSRMWIYVFTWWTGHLAGCCSSSSLFVCQSCFTKMLMYIACKHFIQPLSYLPCLLALLTSANVHHFQTPRPWLNVTRSVQNRTCCLHFLANFLIDQDDIWCGIGADQVKHPDTAFI